MGELMYYDLAQLPTNTFVLKLLRAILIFSFLLRPTLP